MTTDTEQLPLNAVSQTRFEFADGERVLHFWQKECEEHGFPYEKLDANTLKAATPYGQALFQYHQGVLEIEVRCFSEDILNDVRESISHHFKEGSNPWRCDCSL